MLNQMAANQIKNMDKDTVVIMDRSVYSTYAYHIAYDKYYNCGSNLLKINVIGKAANSSIRFPDISIFLYVDEEERVKRLVRRETKLNESNDFDTDVLKLVNAEFQYIAKGLRENGQVVYEFDTTNLDKEGVLEKIVSAIKNTQKQFDFVKVPNYYYRFKL
ncbi:MAG: deoxynucleoside kinase [Candidatus Marsarchaeota archaeon]|nr:deoxynucleoside kinase [Candidatus Marsarchaeota archaeon]